MKKSIIVIVILAALGGVWWYATNGATSERASINVKIGADGLDENGQQEIYIQPDPTADDGFDPSNYDAENYSPDYDAVE